MGGHPWCRPEFRSFERHSKLGTSGCGLGGYAGFRLPSRRWTDLGGPLLARLSHARSASLSLPLRLAVCNRVQATRGQKKFNAMRQWVAAEGASGRARHNAHSRGLSAVELVEGDRGSTQRLRHDDSRARQGNGPAEFLRPPSARAPQARAANTRCPNAARANHWRRKKRDTRDAT